MIKIDLIKKATQAKTLLPDSIDLLMFPLIPEA